MKFLTTTWNCTIVGASLSLENRLHVPSQAAAARSYQTYSLAIRQEYHWVSDDAYRTGRSRVLQQFLGRGRLYHGRELHAYETRARQNLTTELAILAGHVFLSAG